MSRVTFEPPVDALQRVREQVFEVHARFYRTMLAVPGLSPEALPLVVASPEGPRDRFAVEVNYWFYPWLFSDAFPSLPRAALENLCIVAQLFAESLIQLDKVVDGQLARFSPQMRILVLLASQYKQAEVVRRLSCHFPGDHTFWSHFRALHEQHLAHVFREKVSRPVIAADVAEMEATAIGKVALTKILTRAMAELTGDVSSLPALEESQDLFAVGYQLYDDVKDWRHDYEHGEHTYVLQRAFSELDLAEAAAEASLPPALDFGRRLHASNVLEDSLQLSAAYFRRAEAAVGGVMCPKWIAWVQNEHAHVLRLRSDLLDIRSQSMERARLRAVPRMVARHAERPSCSRAIGRGIAFLRDQQERGYVEARHLEMTPKRNDHGDAGACRWGAVFARAITLHTLALAASAGYPIDEAVVSTDLTALMRSRSSDAGWRYFPDLHDLPPDLDDLGEIVHVIAAWKAGDHRDRCEGPIALALANQRPDGGIGTWLASPVDATGLTSKRNMETFWGDAPDVEVVANFIDALWEYDRDRFGAAIAAGAAFVAAHAAPEGFWHSTWYDGPYYGTWAAIRLLSKMGGFELQRARKWLLQSQLPTGAFDAAPGCVLATSFAAMALAHLAADADEATRSACAAAVDAIAARQRTDGSWEESTFLRMKLPRPLTSPSLPGFQQQSYASVTVTTAFAVRALLRGTACSSEHRR